ncbi:KdsC family phosphatase [Bacteroidota bacterium]
MSFFKEELKKVKAFVFDVDGVFSTENLLLSSDGELLRTMNIKDGFSVKYAVEQGYPIGIISGGNSESVNIRFNSLGVTDVYLNSQNKMDDFDNYISKYNINPEEILFMGDDLPDYEIMKKVGLPTCPKDAAEEIKSISKYISDKNGGAGCIRDVIEQVLRAQGKWGLKNNT